MSLFNRHKVDTQELEVAPYHTSANLDVEPPLVTFEPKPDELAQAVLRSSEWTRGPRIAVEASSSPLSVPWSQQVPMVPGLYWWRPVTTTGRVLGLPLVECRLCVVTTFGGSLVVRRRRGDSSAYTSVGALNREWAGPIPIPADAELDDFCEGRGLGA